MCIEEALRTVADRLAMVQLVADLVARHPEEAQPRAFSGLADICHKMHDFMVTVRRALPVESLGN